MTKSFKLIVLLCCVLLVGVGLASLKASSPPELDWGHVADENALLIVKPTSDRSTTFAVKIFRPSLDQDPRIVLGMASWVDVPGEPPGLKVQTSVDQYMGDDTLHVEAGAWTMEAKPLVPWSFVDAKDDIQISIHKD
jgi:hypothetical protein